MPMTASARMARLDRLLNGYMEETADSIGAAVDQETVGQRLKKARLERGWTQRQVARACNVETITVSRWENGRHTPSVEMLRVIARRLGQPLSYFVEEPPPLVRGATSDEVADLANEVRDLLAARDDRRLADVLERMEETLQRMATVLEAPGTPARASRRRRQGTL